MSGGAPVAICKTDRMLGAHWAAGGTILFADRQGILRVSANGGTPQLVIPAAEAETLDSPQLLPDGESVLFSVRKASGTTVGAGVDAWDTASIAVASLASGERKLLLEGGADARYVASGHLVYALGDALLAVGFDARGLRVTGGPVSMVEGVARADLASGRKSRLTHYRATSYLGWSPSGKEITYTSSRGSLEGEVWIQPVDGSGEARQLTALGGRVDFDSWAPDGRTFSAHHHIGSTTNQLMVTFDREAAQPQTWLEHEYEDESAVFSPDGRYIALVSSQTGQPEIYVRPYPGPGAQTPVSVGGGTEPLWAPTNGIEYGLMAAYAEGLLLD